MKASNKGSRNGTNLNNIKESLNVFDMNMDNNEYVETVHCNEEAY